MIQLWSCFFWNQHSIHSTSCATGAYILSIFINIFFQIKSLHKRHFIKYTTISNIIWPTLSSVLCNFGFFTRVLSTFKRPAYSESFCTNYFLYIASNICFLSLFSSVSPSWENVSSINNGQREKESVNVNWSIVRRRLEEKLHMKELDSFF